MFQGRFKKSKAEKTRKPSRVRDDCGSPSRSTAAPSTQPGGDDILSFFQNELNRHLSNKGDQSLFLRIVAAEGFVSRLWKFNLLFMTAERDRNPKHICFPL